MKNKKGGCTSNNKTETKENIHICYELHESLEISCENSECRQWIDCGDCHNCVLISAKTGSKTLQVIGDMYGITRMRICQIEKNAIRKLTKRKNLIDT